MSKNLLALFCFVVLCYAANGASKYCDFTITSTEHFEETPEGPISAVWAIADQVTAKKPSTSNAKLEDDNLNNDVDYIEYEGNNCNVKVTLYTRENFKGRWITYKLKNRKSGKINLSDYWTKNVSSYKIAYY